MSTRTEELVSEWESVPFDGGYAGLHSLADREFSGAVVAGPARLFMLKGTVVGILDGDIEDFEGADGTARQAPHEALPLLAVMQVRADEPRAQYYTQETAIEDVDRTLADGNFTGFIELSENVLSGDYYLVYHQGRSMSVAWVGSSGRLITDDEAFEQANDEVGIYQVMPAEIEMIEIPEPEGGTSEASPVGDQSDDEGVDAVGDMESTTSADSEPTPSTMGDEVESSIGDDSVSADDTDPSTDDDDGATTEPETPTDDGVTATDEEPERSTGNRSGPAAGGPPGSKAAGASQGSVTRGADEESASPQAQRTVTDEATERESSAAVESQPSTPEQEPESTASQAVEQSTSAEASETPQESTATQQSSANAGESATTADLETRAIPSLDPDRSVSTPRGSADSTLLQNNASSSSQSSTAETAQSQQTTADTAATQSETPEATASQPTQVDDGPSSDELADLEAQLADADAEIDRLEGELSELSATNEELRSERDRLAAELETAEAEIERLESQSGTDTDAVAGGTRLSTTEAIDGTNLFVRYHSKGEATLAKAQQGEVDREQVEENIRLEYHTQFDAEDATVGGTAFETFLHDSIQYRFVDWLVGSLLYEIRNTGNGNTMSVLYEALPEIDRAELNGKVSVTYTEDGKETRSQEQFDVVVRDRMGNPLVVANINDSREAATEGQMADLVRDAERVGNASDSLAGAFLVTSSFFEPGALETAEEATASGLFSRDKRKSFVNLSRKEGYHLCLLEARNKEFHLAVPEL